MEVLNTTSQTTSFSAPKPIPGYSLPSSSTSFRSNSDSFIVCISIFFLLRFPRSTSEPEYRAVGKNEKKAPGISIKTPKRLCFFVYLYDIFIDYTPRPKACQSSNFLFTAFDFCLTNPERSGKILHYKCERQRCRTVPGIFVARFRLFRRWFHVCNSRLLRPGCIL